MLHSLRPNSAEKAMAACVWSMPLASGSVEVVCCESSASGMAGRPPNRAGSVSCCIHSRWELLRCSGRIGVADGIAEPACSCSGSLGCRWTCPSSPSQTRPCRSFPAPNASIIGFRGQSGWLAMHARQRRADPPSLCSASLAPLRAGSVWLKRKNPSRKLVASSRRDLHLRAFPAAVFTPISSVPGVLLECNALPRTVFLTPSVVSPSTTSLRNSWA